MKIVHISDIHVSSVHFVPEWGERVIDIVNSMAPEVLVVTGDLTHEGLMHEYLLARDYLKKFLAASKVVVPGNHDSGNMGYEIFEDMFKTRFPVYEGNGVVIQGVDSSEPDIDDGHVGRESYHYIRDSLSDRENIRILALHHHLIPIPGTGRERQIPTDAGDILGLCAKLGINFVFSGHKHRPWIWKLGETYYVTAGTATTRRLKGDSYPSFNVLEIEGGYMILSEVDSRDGRSQQILRLEI